MKWIIISDTHGEREWLRKAVRANPDAQGLIHCGDLASDIATVRDILPETYGVVGNVLDPRFSETPEKDRSAEQLLELEGVRILVTHGHLYDVKHTLNRLYYRALEADAALVLFGHTHHAMKEILGGITFLNPGSPARPRGGPAGYGILELQGGIFDCRLIPFD